MSKFVLILLAMFAAIGCTDAQFDKYANLGNSGHITCFSGNIIIYDGFSTGKILSEENSDGYFFRDKSNGKLMEVSGNCIITYE